MHTSTRIKTILSATVTALLLACGSGSGDEVSSVSGSGTSQVTSNTIPQTEQILQMISSGAAASAAVAACL